jgi:uncharacterized protein YoxC
MTKRKKKTKKRTPAMIRHNPGAMVAAVAVLILTGYVYGMQSKVPSLLHEGKKVTRARLKVEVKSEIARHEREVQDLMDNAEVSFDDLDRQDAFKATLLNAGTGIVQSILEPGASAKGILGLIFPIATAGLLADDIRRNKKVNELKKRK